MTDFSHILFPSDAPKPAAVPEYVNADQAAAELRLAGKHPPRDTQAETMFPSDRKQEASSAQQTAGDQADAAEALFPDDVPDADAAISEALSLKFDGLELSVRMDGDHERADELAMATQTLAQDFTKAGTSAQDVSEMSALLHEGAGRIQPPTAEEAREAADRGLAVLAEGYSGPTELNADLRRAQRFVSDLAKVTPGIIQTLEHSGMGSDPRMIRLAIREAKRRGY